MTIITTIINPISDAEKSQKVTDKCQNQGEIF